MILISQNGKKVARDPGFIEARKMTENNLYRITIDWSEPFAEYRNEAQALDVVEQIAYLMPEPMATYKMPADQTDFINGVAEMIEAARAEQGGAEW